MLKKPRSEIKKELMNDLIDKIDCIYLIYNKEKIYNIAFIFIKLLRFVYD